MKAEMNFDNIGGSVPDFVVQYGVVYGTSSPRPTFSLMKTDNPDFPYNKVQFLGITNGNGTANYSIDGGNWTSLSVNDIVDISSWSTTLAFDLQSTTQNNSVAKIRFFVG